MFKILIGDIMRPHRFNFNKYRKEYDSYSFKQLQEIYNELELLYPKQEHFTTEYIERFLTNIPSPKIMELGGFKGELASQILAKNKRILLWHNYDICPNSIEKTMCKDKRYKAILLEDFAWNLDIFDSYNVCILSHTIEHIKQKQLKRFFDKIKNVKYIYIEAPMRLSWNNTPTTHILECGWKAITNMLRDYKEIIKRKHLRKVAGIRVYVK
ncbi:MAG: hypothetical protein V3V14_11195 [Saprospiraceae bacterium]